MNLYKLLLGSAGLFLILIILLVLFGYPQVAVPLVLIFFGLLLIGIQGFAVLKGFSFTVWVLAAVAISVLYPDYVTNVGGYQTEGLIVPLIQLIMFGMGTTMGVRDFLGVMKMPKGILVGMICQFSIMPVLSIILALTFGFPAEIAAGIVLIGCSPSGVSSNIMTFLARGNLALSITLTSVTTLLAPFMTPLLMQLLAGQFIPIDYYQMMISILNMILLPIIAGMVFNRIFRGRAGWLNAAMPIVAMAANVIIIAVIVAAGRDSLLNIGLLLLLTAFIHNAFGYLLGYWGCRALKMSEQDSRTIAIEVGMQNGGMAAGIASQLGKAATMGLYPAIFGTWMDVSGSFLANWWRRSPINEPDMDPVADPTAPEKVEDRV